MTRFLSLVALLLLAFPACSGKSTTPDMVIMNIAKSLDAGHPEAVWDALPASYQTDIDSVRILFAAHMDKELYDKGFQIFGKLVNVLKTKRDFIMATPMASMIPQDQVDSQTWDTMIMGLEALATSQLSTLEGLKKLQIRQFLATSGSEVAKHAVTLSKLGPAEKPKLERLSDIEVTVVKQEKERATLSIKAGENLEEQEWIVVEGKWIPEDLSREWKVGPVKDQVRTMAITPEQKTQALMIMGMAETALDQLQSTTTQEEFNQVLQGVLGPMMGGMMGGAMGGMGAPGENPEDTE